MAVLTTMTMERWTVFQCAHHLPLMPDGHKCRGVHGHTYPLTIACSGPVGEDGLVFDNFLIDEVLMVVHAQLDHKNLNEVPMEFAKNPTAERILEWVWNLAMVVPKVGPALQRIELVEGERSKFVLERAR